MAEGRSVTAGEVQWVEVGEGQSGQRIDNFLTTRLKGVPRALIYRIVRKGEVRVNKKRVKVDHRLQVGDMVRIPPLKLAPREAVKQVNEGLRNL
ncbi:MAG: 23S rRNA pseudouridine(955/2504/2580) synthase, partial [Halomonadaceae bacterium]|nr:23S rRNA pseudouridine(955/2504/2580) synthase [Halomonadaceae bacterium]